MRSILIIHGSAGNGHRAAAMAIQEALESEAALARDSGAQPIIADSLGFCGTAFRAAYGKGYELAAQHARWLVRLIYEMTDKPATHSRLVAAIEAATAKKITSLMNFIEENTINTVCCTHYLPMALLARMRRQGRFQGKLHVCVTDYQAHGFWADPEVDQYYVATPEAGQRLAGWGVHPSRIMETGIPARKRFARVASAARRAGESLNVLFMTSSLKERECRKLLREMSESGPPLSVTVIGGRNHSLLRALASYAPGPHMRLTMKGHVDNLECLMAESDLVVTKPGGIICTEALCANVPMLFVAPIPMHEALNARLLSAGGAGMMCLAPGSLKAALRYLHDNRELLGDMRQACRRLARPDAARAIGISLVRALTDNAARVESPAWTGQSEWVGVPEKREAAADFPEYLHSGRLIFR